jgi:carbon-monoxide dehydrogenase catalytic subunit
MGDPTVHQMLDRAEQLGLETVWDRYEKMLPECGFGELGVCCRNCNMGPCRISPFEDEGPQRAICGATADIIVARNLIRMIAGGAAAHSDHGRDLAHTLLMTAEGKSGGYDIKDETKLAALAGEYGIPTDSRSKEEIALDLANAVYAEFGKQEGFLQFTRRAPEKRVAQWQKMGIDPRGIDREIVEIMHRTHIGVDNDPVNLILQGLKASIADGWGGSMVATEISDILFGTPTPVSIEVNMGVLKEDQVNIIVHGHEPNLFESMIASVNEPTLVEAAKDAGANGINLVGMCCSGAEVLVRHGIPHAGNFMSTEAVLVTGAVDAMTVDVQCIKQGLAKVADCYQTLLITTNPRCHIEGATHVEFHEHTPKECTDEIVIRAIGRFKNRKMPIEIPKIKNSGVHGFSHEYINYMLGGTFRASYVPLNDNIINGRIRGVAGVVGCTNPRVKQDWVHVELVKELIKNDVLVVQTGCSQIALAKAGLTTPEAAHLAGPGLKEVCETVGMPPVLGIGSCVDNSRILIACSEMVKTGGLGESIADLPVAGAAPEWMSEKAISIGQYFVASGVFTVFGATYPIVEGTKFHKHLFEGLEQLGVGKWGFAVDPYEMAKLMLAHIDKKRKALGIDKARERTLVDMADRREMDAA